MAVVNLGTSVRLDGRDNRVFTYKRTKNVGVSGILMRQKQYELVRNLICFYF